MNTPLLVPVDGKAADWPRRAANAINYLLNRAKNASTNNEDVAERVSEAEADILALQAADSSLSDAISAQAALIRNLTGWGNYIDPASQSIPANTRTLWTNAAATVDHTQKPDDISTFWASNKITGRDGDAVLARLRSMVTPDDGTASRITFEFDIGGSVGVIDQERIDVLGGAGVPVFAGFAVALFMRDTFQANGCSIYVTSDGPVTITEKSLFIQRTHKAQ